MRHSTITALIFALIMFLIPLLALNDANLQMAPPAPSKANVQEAAPITSVESKLPKAPSSPDTTARVVLSDDGFLLRDIGTGELIEVTARDYVRGSLAAEMPPTFHPEALKAQAVAAHTYALQYKQHSRSQKADADLEVDTKAWKGYTTEEIFRERYGTLADAYWKVICEAADSVCGYVLTYEEEPIVAAYHSMSNGSTEDASNVWNGGKPYLVPVESFGDTLAPDYTTKELRSVEEVENALRAAYPEIELGESPSEWLEIATRSESGYITKLAAGSLSITGKELRSLLNLRSSDFTISCDEQQFTFTVNGYGHGVGLSQYGADYMARQGATFDEILLHYYQDVKLSAITI